MPARLAELAVRFGCELRGDPDALVERVAPLQDAGPGAITFLANPHYRRHLAAHARHGRGARRGIGRGLPGLGAGGAQSLRHLRTDRAVSCIPSPPCVGGRHPSAIVEPGADVDPSAWIGPNAFIASGARIGRRVSVGPGSVVLEDVEVGDDTGSSRVTLCRGVRIGARCTLHPGCVIGA